MPKQIHEGQDKDSEKKIFRNEENLISGMTSVGIQTNLTTHLNTSDCFCGCCSTLVSDVDVAELKSVEGYVYRPFFPTHPRYA